MKGLKPGTKKIKFNDLMLYEKKNLFWKKLSEISNIQEDILNQFRNNNNLILVLEEKLKNFVKGHIDHNSNIGGGRIKFLPNGKKLARAGYSIFAKHLTFNNNESSSWAVCYQNTSGTKTYLYTEDNIHLEQEKKYKLVKEFSKNYNKIIKNLKFDLKKTHDIRYLALYTLIKTNIRVGNYQYYKTYSHQGLTTLKNKNIKILKNNIVEFDFIGKDAIPQNIKVKFDDCYIDILSKRLKNLRKDDFVFADELNHPLHSKEFSDILFNFTHEHFYPHIIRSYYADSKIEELLKKNKGKKITKKQIEKELLSIALALGHKKYDKKKNEFVPSYKITVSNYIYPKLLDKMYKLVEDKK